LPFSDHSLSHYPLLQTTINLPNQTFPTFNAIHLNFLSSEFQPPFPWKDFPPQISLPIFQKAALFSSIFMKTADILNRFRTQPLSFSVRNPLLQNLCMSGSSIRPPALSAQPRIKTEPFQIFCLEKRKEIIEANPTLSYPEITSVLGRMWRSLSHDEKMHYIDIAMSYPANSAADVVIPSVALREPSDPQSEQFKIIQTKGSDPIFAICARGASGWLCLRASHAFLFSQGLESLAMRRGESDRR
jgi:hypothetical protein